ncbi:MAG: exodeoxyribonuclease VII small subunit [Firmicutes bacterium]|nr:exodeoxyribonuclease VII small subunit [Bacillota bacterium]
MDNHQTFEENLARLEKIISQLEEGDVPLADSLALFEEGVQLVRRCSQQLEGAEARIAILTSKEKEGEMQIDPFETADE